jgi:sugar O-acyltransferase (sialic acid O-acetyltransferase NeuD family)
MEEVNIFGAGGHTRSLISLLNNSEFKIVGIYDDSFNSEIIEFINSIELMGNLSSCNSGKKIVLSFGDNFKRKKLFVKYNKDIYQETICHKKSFVDETVVFGKSNFVFANAVINANVKIGNNNIINTGAIIEHEVEIGSHNHISVGSIICGRSSIGNDCFLGAGSVIIDKIRICDGVTIGAGAVVTKSINQSGTYVGVPAKKI